MAAAFGARSSDVNDTTGAFSIPTTPGTHDLIVGHAVIVGGNAVIDTAAVQRGVAITAGATMNVDYATAIATRTTTVTVVAPAATRINVRSQLVTSGGTTFRLVDANTAPYVANSLSVAQAMTGDVYNVQILVAGSGQTAITQNWLAALAPLTYTAPTPLGTATTSVVTATPYPLIKTTWTPYASTIGYSWSGTQTLLGSQCGGAACTVIWTSNVSPAFAGTSPDNHMPALGALAGWDPDLQFRSGISVAGYVNAMTSTAGASDFPQQPIAAVGTNRVFVATDWLTTP